MSSERELGILAVPIYQKPRLLHDPVQVQESARPTVVFGGSLKAVDFILFLASEKLVCIVV